MKKKSLLLALGALLLVASVPKEEPGEICRDSIEGSWNYLAGNSTWHFRKGKLRIIGDIGYCANYEYTINLAHSYAIITFSDNTHGIFVVVGDSMNLLRVSKSFPVPADFTAKSDGIYYTFQRKAR